MAPNSGTILQTPGAHISDATPDVTPTEVAPTPVHSAHNNSSVGQTDFDFATLKPDDINFPKLKTLSPTQHRQHESDPSARSTESQFVWKSQHIAASIPKSEGVKGKGKLPDSTPITRQGYRTGRLAEDFWTNLGMPNTPPATAKKLRVIPFLTKNRLTNQAEYLVDNLGPAFGVIAHVHIAEVLAGIPWTQTRARQHVVDEVAQALHKLLIFNNNMSNPFQRWNQGQWYAQWGQGTEGESICTLYVSIDVPEQKVKPRKGHTMSWRREPRDVSILRTSQGTEDIQPVASDNTVWPRMAGRLPPNQTKEYAPPESHNRFSALLADEAPSDQLQNP